MAPRKICVLTASRAEYGLLAPLLAEVAAAEDLDLQLVVSGTHLSANHGATVTAIEDDGFPIAARVDILAPGDDTAAIAATMAAGVIRVTATLTDLQPDILVLLGDRYETLAAATAAMLAGVPVAHIHGGEVTEGAFDDGIRHAVTKLAHLHFTAAEPYRQRVIQLGEDPARVLNVGALAMDNLRTLDLMGRDGLAADLGLDLTSPLFVVTYHPVTLADDPARGARALTDALAQHPDAAIVITGVNADPGRDCVAEILHSFASTRDTARTKVVASLGQRRYLSLLKQADAVIGNSSSGIIEAPAIGTPTVNIGTRQAGRLRAPTVVDCDETPATINAAIDRVLTAGFRKQAPADQSLGDGFAARRMVEVLRTASLGALRVKRFHDLPAAAPRRTTAVTVIAEAGVNHNGSLETALALVDAAADAGADIVKFQTFRADTLVTRSAPKAAYQMRQTGGDDSQYGMLKALELSRDDHHAVMRQAADREVQFLSTPFDLDSLAFLTDDLGLKWIKVGSGDLTNAPLLLDLARRGCTVILSTGMATLEEIKRALGVLAFGYTAASNERPGRDAFDRAYFSSAGATSLARNVTLLHCTTEYPAPPESLNLHAMETLAATFGLQVGFSDHSEGDSAAIAAVALGACVIEKHLTLDRTMPGPDHAASMEPGAFRDMVAAIRSVERALGSGIKEPLGAELANRVAARKSLVAAEPIRKGDLFTSENLAVKRPGTGIPAENYFDWLGTVARRDFDVEETVS